MSEFTKSERRSLRELSDAVFEAEARHLLEQLYEELSEWRQGELASSELLRAIHEFDRGEAKDLWSMYQSLREPDIVARGLALGLIAESSVPAELYAKLSSLVEHFARPGSLGTRFRHAA